MTQYYFGPIDEVDVQLLTEGIVSETLKAHAIELLTPPTRTDDGVTTSVYTQTEGDR